jgi:hypothetical protein
MRISSTGQTTFNNNAVISTTDNTNAALRITQLGTGNALLVEDSTNPDATPFVINNAGRVVQGTTQAYGVLSGGTSIPPVQTHAANATGNSTGFAAFNWATTTGASVVTYAKSRGGVIGTHAVVANGDVIGASYFYGSDGTSFIPAAAIEAEVDGTPGTNDMPGRLTFGTTADGASSPTERMRITNAGNVGIGLTAPPQLLAVGSNTDQFGAGVSGTVTTAYFGAPSSGSGGIKRIAYDRASGNLSVIGGTVASPSTQVLVSNAGRVVVGSTSEQIAASGVNPYVQQQGLSNDAASASITDWQVGGFVGPLVLYNKSKGGAVGTRGAVAANDRLGTVVWSGDDGTAFIPAAQIQAHVDGTPGTNDMPGRLSFFTTADGASSVTERMRIDSAGRVGIGGAPGTSQRFVVGGALSLGTGPQYILSQNTVQSDATTLAVYYDSFANTAASAFTVPNLYHFRAIQGTFGAGSAVTNQHGFTAESSLIGATTNIGFLGNIPAGTGRWNFYAGGTADNYFAGNVGIGTSSPSVSAILDVQSTTKGVRMPNMTTAEKNAIASPAAGLMVFDTTLAKLSVYTGAAWETITSA